MGLFPPGLTGNHVVTLPLDRLGITNTYLVVRFRVIWVEQSVTCLLVVANAHSPTESRALLCSSHIPNRARIMSNRNVKNCAKKM
jgi:hypothetical protein